MPAKKPPKRRSALEELTGRTSDQGKRAESAPEPPKKARAWFHIPQELDDAVRDAVVALSGPPEHLTLSAFGERALRAELERLQELHNDGKPFPGRGQDVRRGRPVT